MTTTKRRDVFDWLDAVRARPSMYVGGDGLRCLETMLFGYYAALSTNGVLEEVPAMNNHFLTWLYYRTRWPCSCGWAHAIGSRHMNDDDALAAFFEFVDEYRQLRPVRRCSVRLGPAHEPTGKRVVIGMAGRMEKPSRVDVYRYEPTFLHYLRFHYDDRIENDWILMTGKGSHKTSLGYAKQWVMDELQVDFGQWEAEDAGTRSIEE